MRGEARDLDVDAVGGVGRGGHVSGGDDAAELVVGGDFPAHGNVSRQAAQPIGGQRIGGQPGPDDEAVRRGIAAGDAQRKQIGAARLGPAEAQHGGRDDQTGQQGAAIKAGGGVSHHTISKRRGADRPEPARPAWEEAS